MSMLVHSKEHFIFTLYVHTYICIYTHTHTHICIFLLWIGRALKEYVQHMSLHVIKGNFKNPYQPALGQRVGYDPPSPHHDMSQSILRPLLLGFKALVPEDWRQSNACVLYGVLVVFSSSNLADHAVGRW